MRYALDTSENKIIPSSSGVRAVCPLCRGPVVGRCGEIIRWHWAHLSGQDCDSWAEHLTAWHIAWQKYLESYRNADIEVPISRHGVMHRADAILPEGNIIELQHSAISPEEIRLRENFYGHKLIWVFDARAAYESRRFDLRKKGEMDTFRWKHPRKSIAFATRKVVLDLGGGYIFWLKKIFPDFPCGGYGKLRYWPELADYEMGDP